MDRSIAPIQNPIDKIDFSKANSRVFKNGIQCHSILQEDCKVVKLEIEFEAGTKYQQKALVAAMVNSLLLEGSEKYTAYEIATFFDGEGAFLDTSCNADTASIVLHCLEQSIPKLLPVLAEIINSSLFPDEEIKNYKELNSQKTLVNLEKVDWLARNEFMEELLGTTHPYSWKIKMNQYNEVSREDLLSFYNNHYKTASFHIYISGKVTANVLEVVERTFNGQVSPKIELNTVQVAQTKKQEVKLFKKDDAVQSAIRLGAVSINRKHKDFPALFVANTILGGYFGSRLMSNIREDKGYTYGIGSGIVHLNQLSYFVISTEVGADVTTATLKEIELEMNKLQTEEVSKEELELVKNYILGNVMKGFDGAFSAMTRFQMLTNHSLGYSYYDHLIDQIKSIEPEKIQEVAKSYFNYTSLKKIIVGKL